MRGPGVTSKIERIRKIAHVVLVCDVEYGHLKWTIVQISKKSNVSRTLIYRYLGKSKLSILENSLRVVFDSLYLLGDFEDKASDEEELLRKLGLTLKHNLRQIRNDPNLTAFATLHYAEDSVIGEMLRSKEEHYINHHIEKKFKLQNKLQSHIFRIFSHGLVNAHFLSLSQQEKLAEFIAGKEFLSWLRKIEG